MEDPSLKNESFLATAERYLEENGSDALLKLIATKCKDCNFRHHPEEIKTANTSVEAGMLTPIQPLCEGAGHVWEDIKPMEHLAKCEATGSKQLKSVRENIISIEMKTIGMQVKEMEVSRTHLIQLYQEKVKHAAAALSGHSNDEKLKEKVPLVGIGQQEKPKQLKNADVAVHNSKLWCGTCNMWFPGEIVMAAHLNGKEHLAILQLPMSSMAVAERYLEENGSDAQEKLVTNKSKEEGIKATDTSDKARMLSPSQVKRLKGNLIWIAKNTTDMQVKETAFSVQEKHSPNENPKEKVQLGATGQYEKLKLMMNSNGATHGSKLWCGFCDVMCSGKIDMAAHLNGRKHLGKVAS